LPTGPGAANFAGARAFGGGDEEGMIFLDDQYLKI
jgi:hypothetical protein